MSEQQEVPRPSTYIDPEANWLDRLLSRIFRHDPSWWIFLMPAFCTLILIALIPWNARQTRDDLSAKQIARDEAAQKRARAFVEALEFEPGPAVCRAISSGSAWCTIRVAGSDKTFSLWCSRKHPTCIESLARE